MLLQGKKIILCVTGSIAAYKAAYLLRGLVKHGAEVQVIMSPCSKEFITPLTPFNPLGPPCFKRLFRTRQWELE